MYRSGIVNLSFSIHIEITVNPLLQAYSSRALSDKMPLWRNRRALSSLMSSTNIRRRASSQHPVLYCTRHLTAFIRQKLSSSWLLALLKIPSEIRGFSRVSLIEIQSNKWFAHLYPLSLVLAKDSEFFSDDIVYASTVMKYVDLAQDRPVDGLEAGLGIYR